MDSNARYQQKQQPHTLLDVTYSFFRLQDLIYCEYKVAVWLDHPHKDRIGTKKVCKQKLKALSHIQNSICAFCF